MEYMYGAKMTLFFAILSIPGAAVVVVWALAFNLLGHIGNTIFSAMDNGGAKVVFRIFGSFNRNAAVC